MPYKSKKQERFAHTPTGMKKFGPATVAEFDKASKGLPLPEAATPAQKPKSAAQLFKKKSASLPPSSE